MDFRRNNVFLSPHFVEILSHAKLYINNVLEKLHTLCVRIVTFITLLNPRQSYEIHAIFLILILKSRNWDVKRLNNSLKLTQLKDDKSRNLLKLCWVPS